VANKGQESMLHGPLLQERPVDVSPDEILETGGLFTAHRRSRTAQKDLVFKSKGFDGIFGDHLRPIGWQVVFTNRSNEELVLLVVSPRR